MQTAGVDALRQLLHKSKPLARGDYRFSSNRIPKMAFSSRLSQAPPPPQGPSIRRKIGVFYQDTTDSDERRSKRVESSDVREVDVEMNQAV
jgi:hypothetical protein